MNDRIKEAMDLIERYGMIDGAHHKQWLIDQIARTLLREGYTTWRYAYDTYTDKEGDTYQKWDEGIAP